MLKTEAIDSFFETTRKIRNAAAEMVEEEEDRLGRELTDSEIGTILADLYSENNIIRQC